MLKRVARARPADLVTIARATFWMIAARVLIRTLDFPRAAKVLGMSAHPAQPAPTNEPKQPNLPAATRRAVRVALIALRPKRLGVSCLPRSIALEHVMRAHGIEAEIVFGVRHQDGFEAHAWVEVNHTPIGWGETGEKDWTPVGRFRSRRVTRAEGAEAAERRKYRSYA